MTVDQAKLILLKLENMETNTDKRLSAVEIEAARNTEAIVGNGKPGMRSDIRAIKQTQKEQGKDLYKINTNASRLVWLLVGQTIAAILATILLN